jgi:hypothetical protein
LRRRRGKRFPSSCLQFLIDPLHFLDRIKHVLLPDRFVDHGVAPCRPSSSSLNPGLVRLPPGVHRPPSITSRAASSFIDPHPAATPLLHKSIANSSRSTPKVAMCLYLWCSLSLCVIISCLVPICPYNGIFSPFVYIYTCSIYCL